MSGAWSAAAAYCRASALEREHNAPLRAAIAELEGRLKSLQDQLEHLGQRIEAAKVKHEFFAQEYHNRLGDYLNEPENARRLFDPRRPGDTDPATAETRIRLLDDWVARLTQHDLLVHVLASYELRNIYHDIFAIVRRFTCSSSKKPWSRARNSRVWARF